MSRFEDGLKIMEERCGNFKDNLISLATLALDTSESGGPRPYVRDLDAFYEDGVFYVTTWAKSTKMQQIEKNNEVAFTVTNNWISGNAIGENLGWVLDPKNAAIREKVRKAFEAWYDFANDETSEDCVILAIRITKATIIVNHGAERYFMDFTNKTENIESRIK